MVDLFVQCDQGFAIAADQMRFHFRAIDQALGSAQRDDLRKLIRRLIEVIPGIGASGMVIAKTANELCVKCVCEFDGPLDIGCQIFPKRHVAVVRSIIHIQQLHFAERGADARHGNAKFAVQFLERLNLLRGQFHHIFDAIAHVDKSNRVVGQTEGAHHGELLFGPLAHGALVCKTRQNHFSHDNLLSTDRAKPRE